MEVASLSFLFGVGGELIRVQCLLKLIDGVMVHLWFIIAELVGSSGVLMGLVKRSDVCLTIIGN